jgi:polysaccharide export outer membrane protein
MKKQPVPVSNVPLVLSATASLSSAARHFHGLRQKHLHPLHRAFSSLLPCLVACLGWMVTSCKTNYPGSTDLLAGRGVAASSVVLSEGDVIRISFPGAPEISSTQKIRSDGKISLAMVGESRAAGLTLPQLQDSLTQLYKPQLQNPSVLVILESSANGVILTGELKSPGKRVFDKPTTLLEAIQEAGGFSEYANESKVRVIRVVGNSYQTQVVDMKGALEGKPIDVVYVQGGDIIHVPE